MSRQRHIIKRQVIELQITDAPEAQRLSDEVGRIYRRRIVPLIERQCDAVSVPGRHRRIERIELNLGALDPAHLERDLVARIQAALETALAAELRSPDSAEDSPDQRSASDTQLELLAVFARDGRLPWWADAADPEPIEHALRELLAHAPEHLRKLLRSLATERHALQRLVGHLSDEALRHLSAGLGKAAHADQIQQLIALLRQTRFAATHPPTALRRLVWVAAIRIISGAPADLSEADLVRGVLRVMVRDLDTTLTTLQEELRWVDHSATDSARALRVVLHAEDEHTPAAESPLPERDAPETADTDETGTLPPQDRTARANRTHGRMGHSPPEAPGTPEAAEGSPLDLSFSTTDELYVGNAGLVILWPFLSTLFARLDLLDGRQFRTAAAQQRAAGLLQYLAAGDTHWPEYLLPLNKLLCGIELDALCVFDAPLSPAEAEECADVLTAVIAQAPILRDMSPDGLRGTFLLRQAILSSGQGAWVLRVERQTYDLVLDRFPWSWSWLKLPWMSAPLRVEW